MSKSSAFRLFSTVSQNSALTPDLSAIVHSFDAPIRFAAAYGSGVFKQASYDQKKRPMIDFIFGVTHPEHWHSLNIRQNKNHYSMIGRYGGGTAVSAIQRAFGAGIYYNPDVNIDGVRIKYGVVGIDVLLKDLTEWNTFYLAGRLQKPVDIIQKDSRIKLARHENLKNAVFAALLYLPNQFSEEDLFLEIAGLSYKGDFRMLIAENPRKIFNMVTSQMDLFRELYQPIVDETPILNYTSDTMLEQDDNVKAKAAMLARLPKSYLAKIIHRYQTDTSKSQSDPEFFKSLAMSSSLASYADKSLEDTVRRPAIMQSLKGLLSAGPGKSLSYIGSKVIKRFL